jgi:hypothetical protein
VGIHKGSIIRYHQNVKPTAASYLTDLKTLGFDMFYGEDYMYGGVNPYDPAGMRMGVKDIKIYRVVNVGGKYYIQNGVTYICTRSTGAPVYHDLVHLVGLYVEVANE